MAKAGKDYGSVRDAVSNWGGGGFSAAIILPKGEELFLPKKAGVYTLNFLPYTTGKGNPSRPQTGKQWFERLYYSHRNVGPEQKSYTCPHATAQKPCPICERRAALERNEDADPKMIQDMKPKKRQLFIVEDVENNPGKRQIWDVSFHLFGDKLREEIEAMEEGSEAEMFYSREDGMTLKIRLKPKSIDGGNPFLECTRIDFLPRKAKLAKALFDNMPCLDELVSVLKYDKLKAIDSGRDDEEDDDAEDEEETPRKKRKPVEDDEDETEDDEDSESDDDADEEEEEETKPAKKKPAAKARPKANAARFAVGDWVEHDSLGLCEVVHVSSDGTSLKLKDDEDEVHRSQDADDCEPADEDDIPSKKKKPAAKKGGKKPAQDEEDEDTEEDSDDDETDDEEEDSDEDDEDEPASKKKPAKKGAKTPVKKKKPDPDEDEESDDEEDDDD